MFNDDGLGQAMSLAAKQGKSEALTAADVREIIREHDRRLAAKLQQAANLIVAQGQKHPDVRPAAFVLRTIVEALEADDG